MLGLEMVRLGAMLESSHQTLLLQQCSAPASLCQPVGLPGQQESEDHQLGKEDTAHLNSAGRAQSHLQGKVAQPHSQIPPCSLPGFLTLSRGHLPLPSHLWEAGFTASLR